jgi:hypothetical protein
LQKYLLYNQGVRESGLATNQEVARSSRAGRTINNSDSSVIYRISAHYLLAASNGLGTPSIARRAKERQNQSD